MQHTARIPRGHGLYGGLTFSTLIMVSKLLLLATALIPGTMAQATSVMDLFLNSDTEQGDNSIYHGSVISAAPGATTYSIARVPENCTEEVREARHAITSGSDTG